MRLVWITVRRGKDARGGIYHPGHLEEIVSHTWPQGSPICNNKAVRWGSGLETHSSSWHRCPSFYVAKKAGLARSSYQSLKSKGLVSVFTNTMRAGSKNSARLECLWMKMEHCKADTCRTPKFRISEVVERPAKPFQKCPFQALRPGPFPCGAKGILAMSPKECMCVCSVAKLCPNLLRPHGLVAHQAPLSMGFSWQEYWSTLPFPSPGDLLEPGIKLRVSCIGRRVLYHGATRKPPKERSP